MKASEILDKSTHTPAQLANKYGVTVDEVNAQLARGMKIELEHTSHRAIAREIALDHLGEKLDYYKKLAKIE